jgi:ribosomal protein S12 methylthiotransferase accessory factor
MADSSIHVVLPGGSRVDAAFKGFTIKTDQPAYAGGENTAPSPFDLFLASLATCAGFYVLAFCQERKIPTAGITLTMTMERPPKARLLSRIEIVIHLPADFPAKYKTAVVKAAEQCTVKATIAEPPEMVLRAEIAAG